MKTDADEKNEVKKSKWLMLFSNEMFSQLIRLIESRKTS